jgi:hypothetical protein
MCSARLAGMRQGSPVRRRHSPHQVRRNRDRPKRDRHPRVSSDHLSLNPQPKPVTRLRPSLHPNPNLRPGPSRLPPNARFPVNGRHSLPYRCGIRRRHSNPSNRFAPDWELQKRVRNPKAIHRLHPEHKTPQLRQCRRKHRRRRPLPGPPEGAVLYVPPHRKPPRHRSKGLKLSQVHRRRPSSRAGSCKVVRMTRPGVPRQFRVEPGQRKSLLRPDHKHGCRPDR